MIMEMLQWHLMQVYDSRFLYARSHLILLYHETLHSAVATYAFIAKQISKWLF